MHAVLNRVIGDHQVAWGNHTWRYLGLAGFWWLAFLVLVIKPQLGKAWTEIKIKQDGCLLKGDPKMISVIQSTLAVLLPPSSAVAGVNNNFAIGLQFHMRCPQMISLLAMPHRYLESRVLSQMMLHLANYSISLQIATTRHPPAINPTASPASTNWSSCQEQEELPCSQHPATLI